MFKCFKWLDGPLLKKTQFILQIKESTRFDFETV